MSLKLFAFLVLFTGLVCHGKDTSLVLVGGGTTPEAAIEYMVKAGGANKANVLVVTWASNPLLEEDKPDTAAGPTAFERMKSRFTKYPVSSVVEAPRRAELIEGQNVDKLIQQIKNSSVIFFSGGDQDYIMGVLNKHPEVAQLLKKKFKEGTVMGGTSAGTAIMSDIMITSEEEKNKLQNFKFVQGLGLVPENWVVDQHFDKKPGRDLRMKSVLSQDPAHLPAWDKDLLKKYKDKKYFGLGVYEDCAFLILNGERASALGPISYADLYRPGPPITSEKIGPAMEVDLLSGVVTNLNAHQQNSQHK